MQIVIPVAGQSRTTTYFLTPTPHCDLRLGEAFAKILSYRAHRSAKAARTILKPTTKDRCCACHLLLTSTERHFQPQTKEPETQSRTKNPKCQTSIFQTYPSQSNQISSSRGWLTSIAQSSFTTTSTSAASNDSKHPRLHLQKQQTTQQSRTRAQPNREHLGIKTPPLRVCS